MPTDSRKSAGKPLAAAYAIKAQPAGVARLRFCSGGLACPPLPRGLRPDLIRARTPRGKGGHANPPEQMRKRATPAGCALIAYAAAKGLPADFLLSVGIREINYLSAPA